MDYNKINTLKLDNNNQIISVLSNHVGIAEKISGFQIAMEQLNSNQKKLMSLYSLLAKDTMAIEDAKNKHRNELMKIVLPVITIMQILAYDKKKKNLLKRLDYLTPEYLQNCSNIELISTSKKIWRLANKYGGYSLAFIHKIKSSLKDNKLKSVIKLEKEYGLIPDMIKNVEAENIKFIESLLLYEDEMKGKEKIVRKIKKLDTRTENLLKNKIDRFVFLFENKEPGFYKEYQDARKNQFFNNVTELEKVETIAPTKVLRVEKSPVNEVNPKLKPKTPQRSRPAKKVGV